MMRSGFKPVAAGEEGADETAKTTRNTGWFLRRLNGKKEKNKHRL